MKWTYEEGIQKKILDDRSASSGGVLGATINFFIVFWSFLTSSALTGADSSHLISNWCTLLTSVWTNSKFRPNRIPEYYSYAMFDRIEYMNNSDLIIRKIRIIRNTFKRLKFGQIMLQNAQNS